MLTVKIPKVEASKSAEDAIAEAVLQQLEEHNAAFLTYYHSGRGQGNWYINADKKGFASLDVIYTIKKAFRDHGYIVNDKMGMNCSNTLVISK